VALIRGQRLFEQIRYFFSDRKQAFEAALLAQTWKIKYEDIKWPKNKGKLGSRKSMVS